MEKYLLRRKLALEQMQKLEVVISVSSLAVFLDLQTVSGYLFASSLISDECELEVKIAFTS